MAKTNWQDPGSAEIRSTHISGLQEAVGKIEQSIGMKTNAETNIPLTEVYISETDRYRIYQAPAGKRNWVSSPAPVIKKNGTTITTGFAIDYGGGAIILSPSATSSDTFAANATCVQVSEISSKRTARFTVGTSTAGWTTADVDYLCDGSNDGAVINTALNALPAHGGEVVILDGEYLIEQVISMPLLKDNITLRGNGNATILKRGYNSDVTSRGLICLASKHNCFIDFLSIDGNKDVYTNQYNAGIYATSTTKNCEISRLSIQNCYGYGIRIDDTSLSNKIQNCIIQNNRCGINIISAHDTHIEGNTISNNTEEGIYIQEAYRSFVVNNKIAGNNSAGISLYDSSKNNSVCNNVCTANDGGIAIRTDCVNNLISNNICVNSSSYGIAISLSDWNTISNNVIFQQTGYTAQKYSIQMMGSDNNYNQIINNNCMGKAVEVGGGTGNSVYGNKWDAGNDLP